MDRRILSSAAAILSAAIMGLGAVSCTGDEPAARDTSTAKKNITVLMVHGAFAGSDGWADVTKILDEKGYHTLSAANHLRGVASDATTISALISTIAGPVVLVGHSYGGMVITHAAEGHDNVKALVYVGAFTPDVGESVVDLSGKFPGSTLGDTLAPVPLPDGGKDLYIATDKFQRQFCADVSDEQAFIMATTQRPITEAAILEKATKAAWKDIPSWHIYGTDDKNIPAAAMKWMAQRAKARKIVELKGASHVPQISRPDEVAQIIELAAQDQQ